MLNLDRNAPHLTKLRKYRQMQCIGIYFVIFSCIYCTTASLERNMELSIIFVKILAAHQHLLINTLTQTLQWVVVKTELSLATQSIMI